MLRHYAVERLARFWRCGCRHQQSWVHGRHLGSNACVVKSDLVGSHERWRRDVGETNLQRPALLPDRRQPTRSADPMSKSSASPPLLPEHRAMYRVPADGLLRLPRGVPGTELIRRHAHRRWFRERCWASQHLVDTARGPRYDGLGMRGDRQIGGGHRYKRNRCTVDRVPSRSQSAPGQWPHHAPMVERRHRLCGQCAHRHPCESQLGSLHRYALDPRRTAPLNQGRRPGRAAGSGCASVVFPVGLAYLRPCAPGVQGRQGVTYYLPVKEKCMKCSITRGRKIAEVSLHFSGQHGLHEFASS
jgi:hypothetical protein